jgi:hypothetical protein
MNGYIFYKDNYTWIKGRRTTISCIYLVIEFWDKRIGDCCISSCFDRFGRENTQRGRKDMQQRI